MELKVDSVFIGRILGGVVIFLGIVSAIVSAAGARSGGFDLFLARLTTPLGVGFLIIVGTEILRVLDKAGDEGGQDSEDAGN